MSTQLDYILSKLENVKRLANGEYTARCKCHDDQHNSLCIREVNPDSENWKILIHCQLPQCPAHEGPKTLLQKIGLSLADLYPDGRNGRHSQKQIIATYDYHDESGKLLYQSVRYEPKEFMQRQPGINGDWIWSVTKPPVRRVLYRLPELLASESAQPVFIVEGEKDADRLAGLGLVATTNVAGAGKWRNEYNSALQGRRVVILPDMDEAGQSHATAVANSLNGIAADIRIVKLPGLSFRAKHGLDVSDWLNAGHNKDELLRIVENTPARTPPALDEKFLLTESVSDEGNAQCLVKLWPDSFLYCLAFGSPGWLYYNGRHWETQGAESRLDRAITKMLQQRVEAGLRQGVDEKGKLKHETLVKFCTPNAYRRKMAEDQLKSLVDASIADFDSNPDVVNCANGVVDLQTGELTPHEPGQRFTYCLPIDYNPQADFGPWVQWLHEVLADNVEMLQFLKVAVGYSLTGRTSEECLFYLFGPTRAGKGTFTETLLKLLGQPLSEGVDFATFTAKRDHDAQNFDLAGLKATRFIVASESNKYEPLNPRRIKAVTGGDAIRCAHKHGRFFTYFPHFKIWLVSNNPVKADAEDDAIWARVNVIHFPISYLGREDKGLKRRMLEASNLEGVLRWAVEGAITWYKSLPDGLSKPVTVTRDTQEHRAKNDYSGQFVEECTEPADGEFLPNPVWKAVYQAWCEANSVTPKIGKVHAKLRESYLNEKGYVKPDELKCTGYDRVIKLADDQEAQHRGFYGVRISQAVLADYL